MKKKLIVAAIVSSFILSACSKSNDGGGSGSPITTTAQAKQMFSSINAMWIGQLKPALTKKAQTYTDYVLADTTGQKLIVNGSYKVGGVSGPSGSTTNLTTDVTVTFQKYRAYNLNITGSIRFFDSYNSRTDCAGANCATSTHKSISYATTDTTAAAAVAVSYASSGTSIADNIVMKSSKQFSTFSVTIINKNGEKFTFYY